MIGGRSDQRVLLPFASSGPGRLECAENKRQISHLRARAPPHELRTSGSSTSVRSDRDPDADTMLGQRLGPASPANNQAPSEAHRKEESRHDPDYACTRQMQAVHRLFELQIQSSLPDCAGAVERRGRAMSVLLTIMCAIVAAVIAWGVTLAYASATIARLQAAWRDEVQRLRAEAVRARTPATQLRPGATNWAQGARQGREYMITMVPLLVAARHRLTEPARAEAETSEGI